MINKPTRYAAKSMEAFLMKKSRPKKVMVTSKGDFYQWSNLGKNSYVFSVLDKKKQEAFKKGMFLFGMVRKDAKAYLRKRKSDCLKNTTRLNTIGASIQSSLAVSLAQT